MSVPVQRSPGGIRSTETSLHEQSSASFHQLYKGLFAKDRHLKGRIGGSSFPETGRRTVSPGGLWQPGTYHT